MGYNLPVVIFGVGDKGTDLCLYIHETHPEINIRCFFDNNRKYWGNDIVLGIKCEQPVLQTDDAICVIAVSRSNRQQIYDDVKKLCFNKVFIWCDEENELITK